ncbi:hypothetical protein ABIB94_008343 [Bradyrhizobium sp. JR7.2]|uniref:hypothetical protein n=1 Tax=unclassified Bradyrhizobium TaxID=2631580 RepID=UPI003392F468
MFFRLARRAALATVFFAASLPAIGQQYMPLPPNSVVANLTPHSRPAWAATIQELAAALNQVGGQITVGSPGLPPTPGHAAIWAPGINQIVDGGFPIGSMAGQNWNAVAITGGSITGLPTPTASSDAATKGYVDSFTQPTQCTMARTVGLIGDGTTDNTAAFNTWLSALSTSSGCLEFGIGKYRFNSAISKTMSTGRQMIQIRGQGLDASILYWPSGGGLKLINTNTNNYVNIHDLSFTTGATNAGNGLSLDTTGNPLAFGGVNTLYNLSFRGDDYTSNTVNSFYWAVGLKIRNWNNVNVYNIATAGLFSLTFGDPGGGIGLEYGCVPSNICAVLNVSNSQFFYHNIYIQLDDFWESAVLTNNMLLGQVGGVGLYVPSGTHTGPLLQLIGNQFNTGGQQIDILTSITQIIMQGNTITTFDTNDLGAILGTCVSPIIVGNMWNHRAGTNTTALSMNCTNGTVVGNIFANTAVGVSLGASSTNVNVSQNSYTGVTTHVSNSGTGNSVGVATQ